MSDRLFHENNMFTRMRAYAMSEHLNETYRALQYMKEMHLGQFRKAGKNSTEKVEYINHPLSMACHAHALGIRDDAILSAILLHDVAEDCGVMVRELPFADEVKELVELVTFEVPDGIPKEIAKKQYYDRIKTNGKACVIKVLDRCNNISTMAGSFSREKLIEYIEETNNYIFPLLEELKNNYPEYNDLSFLVKYHMRSVLESIKNMM